MLTVSLLGRRVARPTWTSHSRHVRVLSDSTKCLAKYSGESAREPPMQRDDQDRNQTRKPSLVEQLFPEETKRYEEEERKRQEREIPRLPLEDVQPKPVKTRIWEHFPAGPDRQSVRSTRLRAVMEAQSKAAENQTSVLVLLNASKNLTEEDFRRLIPQGKHLEGWTLEQGNILKVIPGRNMENLERKNEYYLLFSSPLSAFVYQGQASRISRLVTEQTPNALHNSIPPPPGYLIDGIDAHSAMQAYTLTAPTQKLQLRQLKPPLSPMMAHIVRNGGYAFINKRKDRMPFEARLSLEGPQVPISRIRHIIYESGRDRALAWSGGEQEMVKISQWKPRLNISVEARDQSAIIQAQDPRLGPYAVDGGVEAREQAVDGGVVAGLGDGAKELADHLPRRTAIPVYIVGFETELAAQTFVRYWHRRPMEWGEGTSEVEGDTAPIANVEMLW